MPIIFKGSGFYVTDNRKGNTGETESGKEKGEEKVDKAVDKAKDASASKTKD